MARGQFEVSKILIKRGADASIESKSGETAMGFALKYSVKEPIYREIIFLLRKQVILDDVLFCFFFYFNNN